LLLPAAKKLVGDTTLPLWSYTAVGWAGGKFWVSAIKIDRMSRQRPYYYRDRRALTRSVHKILKHYPGNRLFRHLANCALNYNCRAAQNLFFKRWEAPLPTSPSCNARCLGCLSLQDSDCTTASHARIRFVPRPEEIAEVAVSHLKIAKQGIVSFGQGCEGEPLLQFKTLSKAISIVRRETRRGTVHLNTNAYRPSYLEELAKAGLDSVRISINSFQPSFYNAYYRPKGYVFEDVLDSLKAAKNIGLFVSLNLLVFPGLTDTPREVYSLIRLLKRGYVDLLQMRNLCIDSELYLKNLPGIKEKAMGIIKMISLIRKTVPGVRFGYFNLPKEKF
jgi:pyruvate-formate lyase-activating enzyme